MRFLIFFLVGGCILGIACYQLVDILYANHFFFGLLEVQSVCMSLLRLFIIFTIEAMEWKEFNYPNKRVLCGERGMNGI